MHDDDRGQPDAVLVCQGRAVAEDRLHDATAWAFLRDGEREAVEQARRDEPPQGWADRMNYEMLRANAAVMVPRTLFIDEAVRARAEANRQLVILGAGLDGRAWRMPELAQVAVFEVDHPASQQDKRDRVGDLAPVAGTHHWVPVDLAVNALDPALDAAGHDPARPTTWIWEGVVPYLTPPQVEATVNDLSARSAPGSRLIVNYQAPSLLATAGRKLSRLLSTLARRTDPLAREPWRSAWTPATMRSLLTPHGWAVGRDDDLLTLAHRLAAPTPHPRSLRTGRLAVADRA